jgi:hypothetical protein
MTDASPIPAAGALIQTAFVTMDIRTTMAELSRTMGIGPWFLRERGVFPRQVYRGAPATTALSIAMGYAGDMLFEIIQQLDDSPSVYRQVTPSQGFALHHLGMASTDFERCCGHYADQGFERVYEAEVANGARVAYFDARGRLPAMIEVIEYLPATRQMFDSFRRAAKAWDGTDPVRPLAAVRADA